MYLEQERADVLSIASEIQDEEAISLAQKLKLHEAHFKGATTVLIFAALANILDNFPTSTNNFFSQSLEFFGAVPKWTFLANLMILTYEGTAAQSIKEQLDQMTSSLRAHMEPHAAE